LVAGTASATDMAKRFGIGFNDAHSPIGGRYWFSPKVGFDIGFGISVDDQGNDSFTDWRVSGGIPITIIDVGDRVNFNFLPWVQYESYDVPTGNGTDTETAIDARFGLEFEFFVTKDLSLSAATGVGFVSTSPPGNAQSTTDVSTFGENVTQFGVHYYLGGGGSAQ
jgi:hypothetical protein